MMISTSDSIIRLVVAIILGGLIGYEREARSQSAGLRTHILVCLGACLCMIISINIALDFYSVYGYTRSDPERIAAQVISGVGFLGAGTILANQKGHSVKGLTTAASIWGVAAVGLVVGAGYLVTAAAATVLIFIVLTVFVRLDKMMRKRGRHSYVLHLTMRNTVGQSRRLSEYLQRHQLTLLSFHTLSEEEEENVELELTVHVGEELSQSELLSDLLGMKGIKKASVTKPEEQKEKE